MSVLIVIVAAYAIGFAVGWWARSDYQNVNKQPRGE